MTQVTCREAAIMLGVPVSSIWYGLQQNSLPIGFAYKKKNWVYKIFKEWVEAYIRGDRLPPVKEEE